MNTVARLILFIVLLLGTTATGAAQPSDSCLVLADSTYFAIPNDTVLVDTCNHSLPFWQLLYARKWYSAIIQEQIFDLEGNPDTSAFGWSHVKPWYQSIRDSMENVERDLGPYFFFRVYPDIDDSSDVKNRIFVIRFEQLVNVDSAIERFGRAIPGISMKLVDRPSLPASVVDVSPDNATSVIIKPNVSSGSVIVEILTRSQIRPIRVAVVTMRGETLREWNDVYVDGDGRARMSLDLAGLSAGRYFVRVDDAYYPIVNPGSQ